MNYDSREDTERHRTKVFRLLQEIGAKLHLRAATHDGSKLESPEKETFDKYTPLLKDTTYGSDEYKKYLKEMGVALKHHYENNRHHPEHFENGINDMTLLDIIEMFCDWKAASMRHADGDFPKSLEINKERFGIGDQLYRIMLNTAGELSWTEKEGSSD